MGHDPTFCCGGASLFDEKSLCIDAGPEHFLGEATSFIVVAGHGEDGDPPAESADVVGHVRCPAEPVGVLGDPYNGNGRFRGDPVDLAPDVVVEHDVTHHQNPDRGKPVHGFDEPGEKDLSHPVRIHGNLPCIGPLQPLSSSQLSE